MKKLILILISAALSFACSDPQGVNQQQVDQMVARQDAEAALLKPAESNEKFESLGVDVSSKNSPVAMAKNNYGSYIVAGDKGLWMNRGQIKNVNLGPNGGSVDVDINEKGEWIAAGTSGLYIEGSFERSKIDLGDKGSEISVDINDNGDWIAAGSNGVWVNSKKIKDLDPVNKSGSKVDVSIDEEGEWIVVTDKDIFVKKGPTPGNTDDESSQQ